MLSSYMKTSYFSLYNEIGFVLMLIGVQFGTAIRNVWGIELVNVIMATSVLLTVDYKNLVSFKFPSYSKFFALLWIFQIIELFYAAYCTRNVTQYIYMHQYLLAITFSLSTQTPNRHFHYLDRLFLYSSGFIAVVVAYQATMGFTGLYTENIFYNEYIGHSQMEEGGDKITMGRALLFSIICAIVYKTHYKFEYLVRILIVVFAFLGLFMFNTRASIVTAIICLVMYYYKKVTYNYGIEVKNPLLKNFFFPVFITFSFFLFSYYTIDYVHVTIDHLYESLTRGIFTYWGDYSMGEDESTSYRYKTIQKILTDQYSFKDILFGKGYYTIYIDIPMFQAFYDFGLWGILYFLILGYWPVKYVVKMNTKQIPVMMVLLFSIQYLFDQLYCGLPYFFFQFMPIILLVFFYNNNKNNYELVSVPGTGRQ